MTGSASSRKGTIASRSSISGVEQKYGRLQKSGATLLLSVLVALAVRHSDSAFWAIPLFISGVLAWTRREHLYARVLLVLSSGLLGLDLLRLECGNLSLSVVESHSWLSLTEMALRWSVVAGQAVVLLEICRARIVRIQPMRRMPFPLPGAVSDWPFVDMLIEATGVQEDAVRCSVLACKDQDWPVAKLRISVLDEQQRPLLRQFAEAAGVTWLPGAAATLPTPPTQQSCEHFLASFHASEAPVRSFLQWSAGVLLREKSLAFVQTSPASNCGSQSDSLPECLDFWGAATTSGSAVLFRSAALQQATPALAYPVRDAGNLSMHLLANGWRTAYLGIPLSTRTTLQESSPIQAATASGEQFTPRASRLPWLTMFYLPGRVWRAATVAAAWIVCLLPGIALLENIQLFKDDAASIAVHLGMAGVLLLLPFAKVGGTFATARSIEPSPLCSTGTRKQRQPLLFGTFLSLQCTLLIWALLHRLHLVLVALAASSCAAGLALLTFRLAKGRDTPERRAHQRVPAGWAAVLTGHAEQERHGIVVDLSYGGAHFEGPLAALEQGAEVALALRDEPGVLFPAQVTHVRGNGAGLSFHSFSPEQESAMTRLLYTPADRALLLLRDDERQAGRKSLLLSSIRGVALICFVLPALLLPMSWQAAQTIGQTGRTSFPLRHFEQTFSLSQAAVHPARGVPLGRRGDALGFAVSPRLLLQAATLTWAYRCGPSFPPVLSLLPALNGMDLPAAAAQADKEGRYVWRIRLPSAELASSNELRLEVDRIPSRASVRCEPMGDALVQVRGVRLPIAARQSVPPSATTLVGSFVAALQQSFRSGWRPLLGDGALLLAVLLEAALVTGILQSRLSHRTDPS